MKKIEIEFLTEDNIELVRRIQRDDISEAFVDSVDTIYEITKYGIEHNCKGHTYAIKYDGAYVGIILLGEALEWETDPEEMKGVPFYRLMGFAIDKRYRSKGIGTCVLEKVIADCYQEFGVRPIALGVHKDNQAAAQFYLRNGFTKRDVMEGNDYYYLRYPKGQKSSKVKLYIPNIDDLWFRQMFMADEETMSYNHHWGGTIPFPEETWQDWFDYWVTNPEGKRFYRYLQDETNGEFVGEIAYHYDSERRINIADVIVYAQYRGKGFGEQGLLLLCDAAKANEVEILYDDIAIDNPAIKLFLKVGFCEEYRTDEIIMLKKVL